MGEDTLLKAVMMEPMKIGNRVRWFQYLECSLETF